MEICCETIFLGTGDTDPTPSALADGYAVAYANNGAFLISTAPVISNQLYLIKSTSQAPGQSYIQIELMNAPAIVPTILSFRPDGGRNGTTQGRHELYGNGLAVVATSNPYRFNVPSVPWNAASIFTGGHCYVPGTLIDASPILNELEVRLQANGGGYQVRPPGGKYLRNEVVRCNNFQNTGGMFAHFSVWADYVDRPDGINRMFSTGVGSVAGPTSYQGYGYFNWQGELLLGNRSEQAFGVGLHAWQMGGDETVIHSGTMRDFGVIGSAGYGGSFGDSLAPRRDMYLYDYFSSMSDSDGLDMKNRLTGNRGIHFPRPIVEWFGMGDQGTNLSGEVRPGVASITTVASSTICSVPLTLFPADCVGEELVVILATPFDGINPNGSWPITSVDGSHIYFNIGQVPNAGGVTGGGAAVRLRLSSGMRRLPTDAIRTEAGGQLCSILRSVIPTVNVGGVLTIRSATSGDGVNPNGSWNVMSFDSTRVYFNTGQTPSVGGVSIGGANMAYFTPSISAGDCAIDMRGFDGSFTDATGRGEMWARDGYRSRAGDIAEGQDGGGGHRCIFDNVWGHDLTPAWIGQTTSVGRGSFVSIGGNDNTARGVKYSTTAGNYGIVVGPYASNTQIYDYSIDGSFVGISNAGENTNIGEGDLINIRDEGIRVHGRTTRPIARLPDLPFTPFAVSSAVVIVYEPGHGIISGATVSFTGGTSMVGPGVVIFRSNLQSYTATVTDPDHYTVIGTGAATALTPFGTGDIFVFHGPDPHDAINCSIHDVTLIHTNPSTACIPVVVGQSPTYATGYASRCSIQNVRNVGSNGNTLNASIVDYGDGTMWGQGNIGIFNAPTYAQPATTWTLVMEKTISAAIATNLDFTNLRYYPQIRIEGMALQFSATTNLSLTVSNTNGRSQFNTSDYIRFGDTATPNGVVLAGSTVAGTSVSFGVELSNWNRNARSFLTGSGSQDSSATALTNQPTRTDGDANVPVDAFRLTVAGNFTAGTIRIYQKGA